jgi:hypothetical protein
MFEFSDSGPFNGRFDCLTPFKELNNLSINEHKWVVPLPSMALQFVVKFRPA